jgi:ring-1,2-phenylacetyl-CoA epoxidase subunit PaaD
MVAPQESVERLWNVLRRVPDPEVPALSVVDLGIVRDIRIAPDAIEVDITPTYSGCPALRAIEDDIVLALRAAGAERVRITTVLHPPWTSDWITADARERLRAYGIAPPHPAGSPSNELVSLARRPVPVDCPRCGSSRTQERSHFGATACKSIHVCDDCHEPFEHFKAI